jgi:hypothetical protein
MRDSKQQHRQIAQGSLPWGIANGMCFAKTRVGRYRIRPEAGRFVLSHKPERPRGECAARPCLRLAKACAQAHLHVGMVGNLQGIAGKAVPEIPSLDISLLEASTDPEAKVS